MKDTETKIIVKMGNGVKLDFILENCEVDLSKDAPYDENADKNVVITGKIVTSKITPKK